MDFTHFDEKGNARMVDVTGKADTVRMAAASGKIKVSPAVYMAVKEGRAAKGDVLTVATAAGIAGAKNLGADPHVPYSASDGLHHRVGA